MEKTEAIVFDLGGVILNIDYNLTRKAFENLGIKNFDEMYSQANANDLFERLETGKISEPDFYKEINKRTGLSIPGDAIRQAWNAMLLTFREKSLDFIDALKPKYKLYLLSNTNHIHLAEFTKIYYSNKRDRPFNLFFDKAYYSCEIGLRKPGTAIYEFLLKENKLVASKTLFIDDSSQNVASAKEVGMQSILLEPGKFIEDMHL